MVNVKITTEYIALKAFLKYVGIINNGAYAKYFLQENEVYVNGELERRRGKKLYEGDKIACNNQIYIIGK